MGINIMGSKSIMPKNYFKFRYEVKQDKDGIYYVELPKVNRSELTNALLLNIRNQIYWTPKYHRFFKINFKKKCLLWSGHSCSKSEINRIFRELFEELVTKKLSLKLQKTHEDQKAVQALMRKSTIQDNQLILHIPEDSLFSTRHLLIKLRAMLKYQRNPLFSISSSSKREEIIITSLNGPDILYQIKNEISNYHSRKNFIRNEHPRDIMSSETSSTEDELSIETSSMEDQSSPEPSPDSRPLKRRKKIEPHSSKFESFYVLLEGYIDLPAFEKTLQKRAKWVLMQYQLSDIEIEITPSMYWGHYAVHLKYPEAVDDLTKIEVEEHLTGLIKFIEKEETMDIFSFFLRQPPPSPTPTIDTDDVAGYESEPEKEEKMEDVLELDCDFKQPPSALFPDAF